MKFNKWTMGLAAVGVVSLASAARADETKMSQLQTALTGTTLSGYVDTSAMWNLGTQNGGQLPPYTPNGVTGDGFNLNSIDITLDKPMDESPWASGYHVELMYGQDAVGGYSSGENTANIRQAYLALRTPVGNSGIDWKFGVWDSPIGYESSSDPLNPNFTRSYGWNLEPTTETGLLGTYKVNDMISFSAGVANSTSGNASNGNEYSYDSYDNGYKPYETQKAYMGVVALTAPDSWGWMKGATLTAGVINADIGSAGGSYDYNNGKTWYYLGAVIPTPMTALKFGAAFDYVDYHNAGRPSYSYTDEYYYYGYGTNPSDDNAWAVGAYANYQANDKLSFNLRGEFYDANGSGNNGYSSPAPGGSSGHTFTELTGTVQYQLWANVVSRVELRWDNAGTKAWNESSSGQNHLDRNVFLLALNLCYQF